MAKKTAKKRPKKTTKKLTKKTTKKTSKKGQKAKAKPATVESILAACRRAVVNGLSGKRLGEEAEKYWTVIYTASIDRKLQNSGDTWQKDKDTVLHVAKKLGAVAAALTDGDEVELWAAEAAAQAAKQDPHCRPPRKVRRRKRDRGAYCESIPSTGAAAEIVAAQSVPQKT